MYLDTAACAISVDTDQMCDMAVVAQIKWVACSEKVLLNMHKMHRFSLSCTCT